MSALAEESIPLDLEEPPEGWEDWEPPAEDDTEFLAVQDADRTQAEHMAEWLAGVERRRGEIGRVHQATIDALENRLHALRDRAVEIDVPLARKSDYLKGWLGAYALRERARTGGKVKSVKLLYATVGTGERGGGWTVDDAEALPWLMAEHPDLVETINRVKLADAKRVPGWSVDKDTGLVVTPEGEAVPGIHVTPKTVTATVTLIDTGEV